MKQVVYIMLESGICDYEQFNSIYIISNDLEKVKKIYEKRKRELKREFKNEYDKDEYIIEENAEKNEFEIYLDGYAVDNSVKLEIIKKEIE